MSGKIMFKDKISAEIDRRKLEVLTDDASISIDEIANAEIVFVCTCGREQNVDNDICDRCGKDIL